MRRQRFFWTLVITCFSLISISCANATDLQHQYSHDAEQNSIHTEKVLSDVIAIEAGIFYSCALKKDGTVWCWRENKDGQLGDGTTAHRLTPVQVKGISVLSPYRRAQGTR